MPEYYVLIDKATGNCLGHCLKSSIYDAISSNGEIIPAGKIYRPSEGQKIVIHNNEWPVDETGIIGKNNKYKFDGEKIRAKTVEEISAETVFEPLTLDARVSVLEETLKLK